MPLEFLHSSDASSTMYALCRLSPACLLCKLLTNAGKAVPGNLLSIDDALAEEAASARIGAARQSQVGHYGREQIRRQRDVHGHRVALGRCWGRRAAARCFAAAAAAQ